MEIIKWSVLSNKNSETASPMISYHNALYESVVVELMLESNSTKNRKNRYTYNRPRLQCSSYHSIFSTVIGLLYTERKQNLVKYYIYKSDYKFGKQPEV